MDRNRRYRKGSDGNVALAAIVAVVFLILVALVLLSSGFFSRGKTGDEAQQTQTQTSEQTAQADADQSADEAAGGEESYNTADYPEADRLRISGGIAEAEQLARGKNYAQALETIESLLEKYPDATELQAKQKEYKKLYDEQSEEEAATIINTQRDSSETGEQITLYSPDGSVNVRKEPNYNSEAIAVLYEGQRVTSDGNVEQGTGATTATTDWIHVFVSDDQEGWVVKSLLVEDGAATNNSSNTSANDSSNQASGADLTADDLRMTSGVLVLNPKADTVLRASNTDDSSQIASVPQGSNLYYYGISNTGTGSDGNTHTWCYVQYGNNTFGWVRSDFVTVQR